MMDEKENDRRKVNRVNKENGYGDVEGGKRWTRGSSGVRGKDSGIKRNTRVVKAASEGVMRK